MDDLLSNAHSRHFPTGSGTRHHTGRTSMPVENISFMLSMPSAGNQRGYPFSDFPVHFTWNLLTSGGSWSRWRPSQVGVGDPFTCSFIENKHSFLLFSRTSSTIQRIFTPFFSSVLSLETEYRMLDRLILSVDLRDIHEKPYVAYIEHLLLITGTI